MCSVSGYDDILIYLNGVGESEDLDQWDLIDASIDDNETESEDFEAMLNDTMSVALTATAPGDTRNKDSVFKDLKDLDLVKGKKCVLSVELWSQLEKCIVRKIY